MGARSSRRGQQHPLFGLIAFCARFGTGASRFVLCRARGSLTALSWAAAPGQTPQSISCHHKAPSSTILQPWEEDKDGRDTENFFSGPAFTISFLPGHAWAVKPFPERPERALWELGLEFGKSSGRILHKAGGAVQGLQAALGQNKNK